MCEDCTSEASTKCHVCSEKWWDRDEWPEEDTPNLCQGCLKTCKECNVSFHPCCKKEHKKMCNVKGRAKREVLSARKTVNETETKILVAKRKLQKLEEDLYKAQQVKTKAEKKLRLCR